jgi:hypothetical protein
MKNNWLLNNKNILARWINLRKVHSKEITVRSKILAEKLENIYGLKNEQLEAEIYLQKQHSILDKLRVLPFVDRQLREQMPHWRWKIRPL